MARRWLEEITYYYETILARLGGIAQWLGRLPWETKVKLRAAISMAGFAAIYLIYLKFWETLSSLERWGLYLLIFLVALLTITTALEVFSGR